MRLKIAFGDKMGVGKDTCVDYLIDKFGGTKLSFADPLYNILHYAQRVCNYKVEKDRKFLQFVGTEWARNIKDTVWIDLLLEKSVRTDSNMFVSDIRFVNELEALQADGWTCIKLRRDDVDRNRKGNGTEKHKSEIGIDDHKWDFIIDNDGNLLDLYKKIDEIVIKTDIDNYLQ